MTTPLYSTFPHDLEGMLTDVRPELLRYCRSLTGKEWEAEDLAQETLIRVLCRHAKMPGIKVNKPYVFRIARNLWIDRCRLGRRQTSVSFEELDPCAAPAAPAESDFLITRELLEELMYRLTPKPFDRQRSGALHRRGGSIGAGCPFEGSKTVAPSRAPGTGGTSRRRFPAPEKPRSGTRQTALFRGRSISPLRSPADLRGLLASV